MSKNEKKFDPRKLKKLNNPDRLKDIPPDYLWDKLDMEDADVLVDIGAGTAFFSVAFLQYAKPSKIYACDVSEIMIGWVKENIVPKYPRIISIKSEEHSIPLDDAIADLVFMINLHHELEDPVLTIKEAYRLLKSGGNILIVDWKKEDMPEGPPTRIRCLPEEVMEQLTNAGFHEVKMVTELLKHFVLTGKKA